MSIPGDASPLLLGGGGPQQYKIERSLRFNSSDSAYLSRTPASAGNRKTWTWSGWAKKVSNGNVLNALFAASTPSFYDGLTFGYNNADTIALNFANSAGNGNDYGPVFETTQVFRDASAWYHILVAVDTTQATAANRAKLYVNGLQVTTFSTTNYPVQNYETNDINTAQIHYLAAAGGLFAGRYFSGYLADVHFIDGQALDPTSFAETNITTGQWVPKAYTGTYGTNGFRLAFADNSNNTATTLGKDSSGNGNNWTPNNLSVTAGAGNDSLVDTPTSYGTDTGAGGEVRGNYCTWNPLSAGSTTLSNGNLSSVTNNQAGACGTIQFPPSGKWFFDLTFSQAAGQNNHIGIIKSNPTVAMLATTVNTDAVLYRGDGNIFRNTGGGYSVVQTVSSYTSGDVIGVAVNNDASTVQFYKNGSTVGTAINLTTATEYTPFVHHGGQSTTSGGDANFGQRPFAYTAPSGFKALCDTNLPAPVVAKPNTVFDVVLRTASGSSGATISGLNFSPDFIWSKLRNTAVGHYLVDTNRGLRFNLRSNDTTSELDYPTFFTSVTSTGYTVGNFDYTAGSSVVEWCWDAGSSTVTNTQGSITSQVRANASAGFSIVTYSQGATNGTIGHGLGIAPAFIIAKSRTVSGTNWPCYHISLGKDLPLQLSTTSAQISASNYWGTTAPSATTFGVGTAGSQDNNNGDMVAYCFAPVAGYSSFGSYTGNGSTDGPFIYTGFRSRWVLIKKSSSTSSWYILDTARDLYNQSGLYLYPDLSNAEDDQRSVYPWDILSNGFKPRAASGSVINDNGATYIYAAFAENPFQYARAR